MEGKYIVMSHLYVYNNICMPGPAWPGRTTNGYNYFISAATSTSQALDKTENNENRIADLREMQQLILPELTWGVETGKIDWLFLQNIHIIHFTAGKV